MVNLTTPGGTPVYPLHTNAGKPIGKELQLFNYGNSNVRTVMQDGEPWFVAKDVCDALGLVNSGSFIRKVPDSQKGEHPLPTHGGKQRMSIISEAGLYRLVMRSDKPEAEPFIAWVTEEVLPTIRKTGGAYMSDSLLEKTLSDPDYMIQILQNLKQVKLERDEAIRTKACISDRKTATAMQKAGVLSRKVKKLEAKLGIEVTTCRPGLFRGLLLFIE